MAKVRERLAVNKKKSHRFHRERFSHKKLNEVEGKGSIMLRLEIGLQVWKIWIWRWKLIVLGKILEKISNFSQRCSRLL
jgi:hypothetical protein